MTCTNPLTIHIKNNLPIDYNKMTEEEQKAIKKVYFRPTLETYEVQIPCGRCLACRLDHADMWATRVTMESKTWKNNCFVTLTYNNDNYPENGSLIKKDVQDFLKRLRYHVKGYEEWENPKTGKIERPIRYFGCGEYGPKFHRPHYHLALFNYIPKDLKFYKENHEGDFLYKSAELQKIWGHGFVVIGLLTPKSANYIARYVQKKAGILPKTKFYKYNNITGEKTEIKRKKEKEDEFIIMSTGVGLGRKYWEENKNFIKKYQYISINCDGKVKQKPLPRYFKKLWEDENWEDFYHERAKKIKEAIEKQEKIMESENYENAYNNEHKWRFHLLKTQRGLIEKARALKRNNFV